MEVSGQFHAPAVLLPGKKHLVPIGYEDGWDPEPFWTRWWREKFPTPGRESNPRTPIVQPVAKWFQIYFTLLFFYFGWKPEGKDQSEDLSIGGRIILERTLEK
jgi:hypothetical protein